MPDDAVLYALATAFITGLFLLAYWHDIRDARLFAAMNKAAAHPYCDRDYHHAFALAHGLFWGPCPQCTRPYGGHEMTGKTIPHPDPKRAARGERVSVCPDCSLDIDPYPTSKAYKKTLLRRARKG